MYSGEAIPAPLSAQSFENKLAGTPRNKEPEDNNFHKPPANTRFRHQDRKRAAEVEGTPFTPSKFPTLVPIVSPSPAMKSYASSTSQSSTPVAIQVDHHKRGVELLQEATQKAIKSSAEEEIRQNMENAVATKLDFEAEKLWKRIPEHCAKYKQKHNKKQK